MAFVFLAGAALGGLAGYGVGAWTHPYYWYGYPQYYSPYYAPYSPYYSFPGYWYW